jgi:DNA-binding IclR family transcriptional regulator
MEHHRVSGQRSQRIEAASAGEHAGEDPFAIRALARGLRLLALFTVDHPEWTLTQLYERTGLHKATTYRITRTMEAEGFLVLDRDTGAYRLGPAALPMSYLASSESELLRIARPYLVELAEITGETTNLAVENEGTVVVIGQELTSHPFKPSLPVGRVMNDLANAHSKVFAAYKSSVERDALLRRPRPKITPNTITDGDAVRHELERVEREGVAYDLEEHGLGICSVAAPVRDQTGGVRATLSVVAPKERFGPTQMIGYAAAVKRVAAAMSAYLGFQG